MLFSRDRQSVMRTVIVIQYFQNVRNCVRTIVTRIKTRNKINTIDQSPYFPDLVSCDFFLFPKPRYSEHLLCNNDRTKSPFYFAESALNSSENHRRFVVFGLLWVNAASILKTAFSLINIYAKWGWHVSLISLRSAI